MEVIKDKKQAAVMPLDHITPRVVWTPENKIKQIRVPKKKEKSDPYIHTRFTLIFWWGEERGRDEKEIISCSWCQLCALLV